MSPAAKLALADATIVALAVVAALNIRFETNRSIVRRWRLLVTGFAAAAADLILLAYPSPRDLFQVQLWMVAALALLAGLGRGTLLPLFSDHKWDLIRMRRTHDGFVGSWLFVLFALFQAAIEIRAGTETHIGLTMELVMTVVAGYLLGRSVSGWLRARTLQHEDIGETTL